MPYMISDNGRCVHRQNANGTMGEVVKCHDTPEEAAAHMAALYANVEDASAKENLFIASEDAELSDAELQAIDQLYRDIGAGKVTLESLAEPDAVTGKASVSYGNRTGGPGGPAGNPSGTPGWRGLRGKKQERCFLHVKKLGADESTARRICRSMFGESAKETGPASDYLIVEDAEQPSTYHLRVKRNGTPDHGLMGAAFAALHGGYRGNVYEGPGKQEAIAKLKRLYEAEGMPVPSEKTATFAVYKQADGNYRWLAVTSSSFQDRDKEFVSQKALEADAERMNASGDYGTLDWWHTPIVLGACDFSAMHGRLSVESGTFRDAWIATKLAEAKDGFEMSRAFYHPITEPDSQGVYHNIKTFSRAIIPQGIGKASNLLTTFAVVKEEKEMLVDKVKELVAKLGGDKQAEEKVNALLAEAEQKEKAAAVAGIAHKEAEAAPEAKPAPVEEKETSISKQPGMFVADMTPEEFDAHIANAVKPLMEQLAQIKEANATAVKESSASVLAAALVEIKKLQDAQAETAKQVKELNGLTPRGYRATQDPATATTKDAKPGADEKRSHFEQFVNGFVLGQPQPPV